MNTSKFFSISFSISIALMVFGSVYQPAALGYLGASPGIVVLAALLPLLLAVYILDTRCYSSMCSQSWGMLAYGLVLAIPAVVTFGVSALFFQKTISLFLLCAIWISPFLIGDHLSREHLYRGVLAGFVICLFGYVISDKFPSLLPDALRRLIFDHAHLVYEDPRPRGFMEETSHFASIFSRYALILFVLRESGRPFSEGRMLLFSGCMMAGLAITGSKGAALSIVLAFIVANFKRKYFLSLILCSPIVIFIFISQFHAISADYQNFTSTSTRLTLWLAGSVALLCNPFGYGYYGFYPVVKAGGSSAINFIVSYLNMNFKEVIAIVETMQNVSFKSTVLDFLVIFGLFFIVLIFNVLKKTQGRDPRVRMVVVYLFLSSLSTSGHESFSFFLGLMVLNHCFPVIVSGKASNASYGLGRIDVQ